MRNFALHGSLRRMARNLSMCGALLLVGCANNPYVIGRLSHDAGDDAGRDAGSACPGAILCSGFEGDTLASEWPNTHTEQMASIELSSAQAHSGKSSLHATSTGPSSRAVIIRDFPALTSGDVYLRVYAYLPEQPLTQIMNFMFVGGDVLSNEVFEGIDYNLDMDVMEVFLPLHDPTRYTGSLAAPHGRWFCLRSHILLSETDGRVQVYIDDALAVDVPHVDTIPDTGLRQFRAGIDWSSEQADRFDIYLDDLLLDTREVACD